MAKGLMIVAGPADKGGSDVEQQERRNALRAFFSAAQSGDIEAGMKAWARMGECGPPPTESMPDEDEAEAPDIAPKGKKTSMYREED